jgi:2',3'-cyclic-nucleotide 2'-phosphodiesterase (5'-nucleotidase family)
VRVVATHDFCCSYLPSPTSYGSLPGGEGLKRMVDRLRRESPTVRADAGDFAAPGALATLSGGEAGFGTAADLGIDVACTGNHEFEWGTRMPLGREPSGGTEQSSAARPPRVFSVPSRDSHFVA